MNQIKIYLSWLLLLFIVGCPSIQKSSSTKKIAPVHALQKSPEEVLDSFIRLSFQMNDPEAVPVLEGMTTGPARYELQNMTFDEFNVFFKDRRLELMEFQVTDLFKENAHSVYVEYRMGFWDLTPTSGRARYLNKNIAKMALTQGEWRVAEIEFISSIASFEDGREIQSIR